MAACLLVTGLLLGIVLGTEPRPRPLGDAQCTERAGERGPTGGTEILSHDKGGVPLVPVKDPTIVEGRHGAGGGGCAFAHERVPSLRVASCLMRRACSSCTLMSRDQSRCCWARACMTSGRTVSSRPGVACPSLASRSSHIPTAVQLTKASCRSTPVCSNPSAMVEGG